MGRFLIEGHYNPNIRQPRLLQKRPCQNFGAARDAMDWKLLIFKLLGKFIFLEKKAGPIGGLN
jgi:hypothetical protein